MKKNAKVLLTRRGKKTILPRMPVPTQLTIDHKRSGKRPLKVKKLTVAERYKQFFIPNPSPLWQQDYDNFSLDQPSPMKWVKTETTYGIDVTLCPLPNA